MEKLTHTQLLSRLAQFSGAQHEAAVIDDQDFARECADVVSVITEVLETRTKLAGIGATFIDIPMMPRTCVTSTAISILKAARAAGERAVIATTDEQAKWLMQHHDLDPSWWIRVGDLQALSFHRVFIVDDAQHMEARFSKIHPNIAGLRAHLAERAGARVYWLTS
ncbi:MULTISPECIES: hypothetical protein [Serratia]|uniref:hypothetical protein n=1 Tax=Serratia TaxID=613 RepID=UPI00065F8E22|nr:hypothetical protein [Serratia sp. 506_PEND]